MNEDIKKNLSAKEHITEASGEELERQRIYMQRAKEHVKKLEKILGRKPTSVVTTFGCQMISVA